MIFNTLLPLPMPISDNHLEGYIMIKLLKHISGQSQQFSSKTSKLEIEKSNTENTVFTK